LPGPATHDNFLNLARRIAALILLQPGLDQNYQALKSASVPLNG
jgi:hypothetical protein